MIDLYRAANGLSRREITNSSRIGRVSPGEFRAFPEDWDFAYAFQPGAGSVLSIDASARTWATTNHTQRSRLPLSL
jgi:hypothetical protein